MASPSIESEAEVNEMKRVIEELQNDPEGRVVLDHARVVGKWLWVTFPSRPRDEVRNLLKATGFRWNQRRECWQHSCGVHSKPSPGDPRERYGDVPVRFVEDELA